MILKNCGLEQVQRTLAIHSGNKKSPLGCRLHHSVCCQDVQIHKDARGCTYALQHCTAVCIEDAFAWQ